MGAVLDVVKRNVPASYRALVSATDSYERYGYGATVLQDTADFVQFRLFGTVPGASNEVSVYDRKQIELAGILTTLQFIPAAVDYWGDQLASESLTGTHENAAWFDRRKDLWNVFDRLTAEAKILTQELGLSYGVIANVPRVTYGDNGRELLITTDPAEFPAEFDSSTTSIYSLIPWRSE